MPPRRRKVEIQPSRTEMHQGVSGTRNENKWADVMNLKFSENKTTAHPRKKVYLTLT